jgi:hypothetical protein
MPALQWIAPVISVEFFLVHDLEIARDPDELIANRAACRIGLAETSRSLERDGIDPVKTKFAPRPLRAWRRLPLQP